MIFGKSTLQYQVNNVYKDSTISQHVKLYYTFIYRLAQFFFFFQYKDVG